MNDRVQVVASKEGVGALYEDATHYVYFDFLPDGRVHWYFHTKDGKGEGVDAPTEMIDGLDYYKRNVEEYTKS